MKSTLMNTTDLQNRIGLRITGEFVVEALKVQPDKRERKAMYWDEKRWPSIRSRLAKYIAALPDEAPPKTDPQQADEELDLAEGL